MSNSVKIGFIVLGIIACILAGVLLGNIYNNRGPTPEYGAVVERLGQIDRDLKSEFRNLHQTIDRGGKETGETRIIVEGVRHQVEGDRVTRGELQITSGKLKDLIRKVRSQEQKVEVGKPNP